MLAAGKARGAGLARLAGLAGSNDEALTRARERAGAVGGRPRQGGKGKARARAPHRRVEHGAGSIQGLDLADHCIATLQPTLPDRGRIGRVPADGADVATGISENHTVFAIFTRLTHAH